MFLKALKNEEKSAFYTLAKELMAADGIIADTERFMLDQFLDEMNMSTPDMQTLTLEEALNQFALAEIPVRKQVYLELMGLVMCDGVYDAEEEKLMEEIAKEFGLLPETAEQIKASLIELLDVYARINALVS